MKAIQINNRIIRSIPSFWIRPDGSHDHAYNTRPDEVHYEDGWRDVVTPPISENQRLGEFFFNEENDVWTYQVIDLTPEEIAARFESQIEGQRSEIIEQKRNRLIMESFQAIEDEEEAFEVKEVFHRYDPEFDYLTVSAGYKVTRILIEEDQPILALFFLIQPHAPAQGDPSFLPENAPALWSRVLIGQGGVEAWTQPTGGDGKYPYLNPSTNQPYQVSHNGRLWENNFQGGLNVWEPGVFGWTDLGAV